MFENFNLICLHGKQEKFQLVSDLGEKFELFNSFSPVRTGYFLLTARGSEYFTLHKYVSDNHF